ncbi:MAG: hypothetical protein WCE68_00040 [Anaerolineales bacterium]
MAESYTPKSGHIFTSNAGHDPSGGPVREAKNSAELIYLLGAADVVS